MRSDNVTWDVVPLEDSPYKSRVIVASNALLFLVLKMRTPDLQYCAFFELRSMASKHVFLCT